MTPTQMERNAGQHTANTVAVVLAGGPGSGLKGLTKRRAKPAVPFGGTYRIIDFPLSNCINSGIRRISVLAQFNSHSLQRHLRQAWTFLSGELGEFVEMHSAQPGAGGGWYEGTADAVYKSLDTIRPHDPLYVLILSGDQVYQMDYGKMIAIHAASGADLTVACIPVPLAEATAFGVVTVDESRRIVEFTERPERPDQALASMGIYVFTAGFLRDRLVQDAKLATSHHDFGQDIIPAAVQNANVSGFDFVDADTGAPQYWRYIATLDAYWKANADLVSPRPGLDLYDATWPIRAKPGQFPPAKFVSDEDGRQGHAVDSLVSEGCLISGATIQGSVLSSNVRVHSCASVEDAIVLPGVDIGRHCRIRRTIVEEGVVIPEGMEIGYDLAKDRERFEVSDGGIVLVTLKPQDT